MHRGPDTYLTGSYLGYSMCTSVFEWATVLSHYPIITLSTASVAAAVLLMYGYANGTRSGLVHWLSRWSNKKQTYWDCRWSAAHPRAAWPNPFTIAYPASQLVAA
ncbi:hypothetical protein GGR50DRAFT_646470 [Xylaria sp. CBS 124048]|nr:hypothetical protein GGR50DRAFT_646470 [Xylaria sp. CBS 124048]